MFDELMPWLTNTLTILELCIAIISILGFLWGSFIWVIKPIKNLIHDSKINAKQNTSIIKTLDEKIIPFIESMTHEFNPNSGKSIKDQLNRIDDAVRLGELRSKMISNSLVTTGAYECDKNGNCTWVNNALAELSGMSKDEMLGQGWLSSVKYTERQKVWEDWHAAVINDIPFESEYTVVNQKTRTETRVRTVAVAHKSLDYEVLGFYGTLFAV